MAGSVDRAIVRLAWENPGLRGKLAPVLKEVMTRQSASSRSVFVSPEEAARSKRIPLAALQPSGVKAGLKYYRLVIMYRAQAALEELSGKVPRDKIDLFFKDEVNNQILFWAVRDRDKLAHSEEYVYEQWVDPAKSSFWKRLDYWVKAHGSAAGDLRPRVEAKLKNTSDEDLIIWAIRSGIISTYSLRREVKNLRDVSGRTDEYLTKMLKELP